MNEQYPSNVRYSSAGECADEEMKKTLDDRSMGSLIVNVEKVSHVGHVRLKRRKQNGKFCWVSEHCNITGKYEVYRVPLPENGEHVGRRGRKATGQGWALIAGLSKDRSFKRQRKCQELRAH